MFDYKYIVEINLKVNPSKLKKKKNNLILDFIRFDSKR